jgi:hypothetical protein
MKKRFQSKGKMRDFSGFRAREIEHEISNASKRDAYRCNTEQLHASCCDAPRTSTESYINFVSHLLELCVCKPVLGCPLFE